MLILFVPAMSWAQPGVASKVEVDGVKYYQHIVEAGNTLWGLQRMYGVKVEEIVSKNPELKNGLQVGHVVLIPVTEQSIQKIPTEEYRVKKKETLYGISKKFSISVDDLIVLNPELKDGLKKGQVIKVPKGANPFSEDGVETVEDDTPNPFVTETENDLGEVETVQFVFEDSIVQHKVLAHETMYAVSKRFMVPIEVIMETNNLSSTALRAGQVLKIPIKLERVEEIEVKGVPDDVAVEKFYDPFGSGQLEFEEKPRYKVAIMLPFMTGLSGKRSQAISKVATQIYMGSKVALDSLNEYGLNADVLVFDTKNDSTTINELLHSEEMEDVDVIIGPLFKNHFKQVAEFGRENKVRVVLPAESETDIVETNRLVYQTIPSDDNCVYNLGRYIAKNKRGEKVILVKTGADSVLIESFKSGLANGDLDGGGIRLIETTSGSVTGNLVRGINTHVIVLMKDPKQAKEFFTLLNRGAHRIALKDLHVYGPKDWSKIDLIPDNMKNKFRWKFASSNFIDYYTDEMIEMNKLYREKFNTDFSKMAVHGYDLTSFFLSNFFKLERHPKLLMSRFDLEQLDDSSGYMNRGTFVVENDKFELFNSEIPHD